MLEFTFKKDNKEGGREGVLKLKNLDRRRLWMASKDYDA